MKSLVHHLASTVALVSLAALLFSFAPLKEGAGAEPPMETLAGKCCNPASPIPPGQSNGCATDCTEGAQICAVVHESGSWSTATCTSQKESECSKGKREVPTPKFSCSLVPCQVDGAPGHQCAWTLAGLDNNDTQKHTVCSGTPCKG